ncbi:MAG: ABC transporter ATP-binding protein [Halanaerobiaceae bacterium]
MLELKDVTKIFHINTASENCALKSVNLKVKQGDYITIVGSNGAGKSSLLNCIAGVYSLTRGKIILEGEMISGLPEYMRATFIGRVFQDPLLGTSPEMTIEENLSLALIKNKRPTLARGLNRQNRNKMKTELEKIGLGLENRLDAKVKLLSGGQRQALTLLMATMVNPQLLLLDEHTAALDPATAIKIKELTRQLIRENEITTLMVTHDMQDAIKMGNRLIMMDEGRIILDIQGDKKQDLTVEKLLELFRKKHGKKYSNDRTLLTT